MLFNSYLFVFIFLPVSILVYFSINKMRKYALAEWFLIGMSLWFYAYFNVMYLIIILCSILINYLLAKLMQDKNRGKKVVLLIGILVNIGILFYFKYMGFFVETINVAFRSSFEVKNIMLPLGISFFTFQQVSYLVDSYKDSSLQYEFRKYALFVVFFPQLIAGPIVLHSETIPQFSNNIKKKFNQDNFVYGLRCFALGMSKKVLIADLLGKVVEIGYSDVTALGVVDGLILMLSYTLQVYFDFSGYSDMAVGIGKMFNIDIPFNFKSPYKAFTITEFWERWHITLTRFLKNYLYIPLGGNRKGKLRTYVNLGIVFLLSGLWHGANVTFIVWGMLHGIAIILTKIFDKQIKGNHPALNWLMTFSFINIAWVFFRADSIGQAMELFRTIAIFNVVSLDAPFVDAFLTQEMAFVLNAMGHVGKLLQLMVMPITLIVLVGVVLGTKNTQERLLNPPTSIGTISCAILMGLSIISFSGVSIFIYFNF